ncbi:MAG TPA: outer membrane beta-barrel protein [Anaeromyxobacter sp.]|nr:outer membrane beta-barrel protein [Anaeromyxobacter sp.]
MRSLVASFAALALAVPAAARAQPVSTMGGAGPDTYLELHLGAFVPQSSDLDALDPNVDLGLTFGARFTQNLSAEIETGYYRASATESSGVKGVMDAIPIVASLRFRYPLKVAELSAFGGGGIHFAHTSTSGLGAFDSSASDTAFGYHLGGEAAFMLSPTMRVGFEVRRTFVNASFDGADTDIGGLRLAATLGYHF